MPVYEYRCLACKRNFELYFSYHEYGSQKEICPYCESDLVRRRIGRVRIAKSEQSHLENMADPTMLDSIDEDPRALGRMMRQMSGQVGEDMGPEFNEVVDRLERGQSPDQIEKELPDFGSPSSQDDGDSSIIDDF